MTDRQDALPVPGLIRRVRRIADLSQRQLADHVGVARSTIARIETGARTPGLPLLMRLLAVADLRLVVVDSGNRLVEPMRVWDDRRDGAERRYPAHLDIILDPKRGEWWADIFGLARPPETFRRDRAARDYARRQSQWEVGRGIQRSLPPPTGRFIPFVEGWR